MEMCNLNLLRTFPSIYAFNKLNVICILSIYRINRLLKTGVYGRRYPLENMSSNIQLGQALFSMHLSRRIINDDHYEL